MHLRVKAVATPVAVASVVILFALGAWVWLTSETGPGEPGAVLAAQDIAPAVLAGALVILALGTLASAACVSYLSRGGDLEDDGTSPTGR